MSCCGTVSASYRTDSLGRPFNFAAHRIPETDTASSFTPTGTTVLWSNADDEIRFSFSWCVMATTGADHLCSACSGHNSNGHGTLLPTEFRQAGAIHISALAHAICTNRAAYFNINRAGYCSGGRTYWWGPRHGPRNRSCTEHCGAANNVQLHHRNWTSWANNKCNLCIAIKTTIVLACFTAESGELMRSMIKDGFLLLILPITILVVWWFLSYGSTNLYAPSLQLILWTFAQDWLGEGFFDHALPSLGKFLAGFLIASFFGILIGTLIGFSRRLSAALDPVIQFVRAIPP